MCTKMFLCVLYILYTNSQKGIDILLSGEIYGQWKNKKVWASLILFSKSRALSRANNSLMKGKSSKLHRYGNDLVEMKPAHTSSMMTFALFSCNFLSRMWYLFIFSFFLLSFFFLVCACCFPDCCSCLMSRLRLHMAVEAAAQPDIYLNNLLVELPSMFSIHWGPFFLSFL